MSITTVLQSLTRSRRRESDLTSSQVRGRGLTSVATGSIMVLLLIAMGTTALAAPRRPGKVQLSNGETMEGAISLSPGEDFRLHVDGNQIRALDFERVREIRIAPAEEKMVQKWRFLEAGQVKKELSGKPYLIRSLAATVLLAGGEKVTGHLYTTVLYLESGEKARKVILPAKQRGKEGENADVLVYPALITFTDGATGTEETIRLRINLPELTDRTEVAALTWGALFTLEGSKTGPAGEYKMPSPLGREMFLAVKTGTKIVAGWPKSADPKFTQIVQTNLVFAEDFFDQRKLLGVLYDEPNLDIYSLLMLRRTGQTTMDGNKTQPWRLVILRWKYDPESQRVLLAGRGCLFRGILPKNEAPPEVTVSDQLWKPTQQGEVWVTGR
jgi:hypothetical protein